MNKFREIDKRKRTILISGIGVILLIAIILIYRTYAIYQEAQDFDVIRGNVPEYMNNYDVRLSLTLDGVEVNDFPSRDSGKVFLNAECDKGATGLWDYEIWGPKVLNATQTRTKCKYHFVSKYSDSVLNGTDPVLKEGLIPVVIDDSGKVRKANESSEWYNYSNKKWANAVILEDESIKYVANEEIPENNIESYFVWIPRYRYKIFNEGNYTGLTSVVNGVKTIEIEFENRDEAIRSGSHVGEWLTHPAFTAFDVNGMWVGKFETGYKGAQNSSDAQKNEVYISKVTIKPNVYSWGSIKVSNAFMVSYEYQRSMDSHMMKNTEWGAVAYLHHSAYGSQQSVRINNNSAYLTGYASVNEPACGVGMSGDCFREFTAMGVDGTYTVNYKNPSSMVASTTGNYSGIYDMSGGSWEYVMGVMADESGNPVSGRSDMYNSGFIGTLTYPNDGTNKSKTSWTKADGGMSFPDSKYYDKYAYGSNMWDFHHRLLGDAMGEMGPFGTYYTGSQNRQIGSWYHDEAWFINGQWPWIMRSGALSDGYEAGIFSFERHSGFMNSNVGFRIVLAFS